MIKYEFDPIKHRPLICVRNNMKKCNNDEFDCLGLTEIPCAEMNQEGLKMYIYIRVCVCIIYTMSD